MTVLYSNCLSCHGSWPEEHSIPWTRTHQLRDALRQQQQIYAAAGCLDPVHQEVFDRLAEFEVVS